MKSLQTLKLIRTTRRTSGRFEVVEDLLEIEGEQKVFSYMSIRDGACILPFYEGKIVLLHEYRYPVRSVEWSLPGGSVERGEDPALTAARELEEETGFRAGAVHSLGAVFTSFGSSDERIHLSWTDCVGRGESAPEATEFLEVYLKEEAEFRELIRSGAFMHGAGLAAWARYLTR